MGASGRRSLRPDELRIWRDYIETSEVLRSRLSARMLSDSSISSTDYAVLLALHGAEGRRVRSSELADVIGWERSRLSHHLGRMEKRELIRRDPCVSDTRGAEVSLTETGASALRRGSVPHLRAVRALFLDALSEEQLAQVESFTASLRSHLGLDDDPIERTR